MDTRDHEPFVSAMSALAAAFRVEPTEALYEAYWMTLEDLPLDTVLRAIKRALTGEKRMPVPAEVRELCGEVSPAARAVHAFDSLRKAISRYGSWQSVDFDDRALNATVRSLGGWERLCSLESEELNKWTRKDFERVYLAHVSRGVSEEAGKYLAGEFEKQNVSAGHNVEPPKRVITGLPTAPALPAGSSYPRRLKSA